MSVSDQKFADVELTARGGQDSFNPSLEDADGDEPLQSTRNDAADMRRMGRSQELVRHYRLFSMVSFVAVATSAWELTIFQVSPALINGGLSGLVYSSIWSFVCSGPVILSMAEMSSMAPIAGAQYHWVSEFSPEKYQKILSYITGWTSTLAWQSGNAGSILLIGTLIQTIIGLNFPDYSFPSWHGTLIAIGTVVISCVINIFGSRILPQCQNAFFAIGILVYFAFLLPIWVTAPRASSSQVWADFTTTDGGWPGLTLAILVGQQTALIGQVGIDTATHMSEEVRNASKTIPRVMLVIYAVNFVQNILTVLTISYHIPDLPAALQDASTYPAVWVLRQTMSSAWITVLLSVIVFLLFLSNLTYLIAVSRDLFAFARDRGIPFFSWIGTVERKRSIPTNAYIVTCISNVALSLIYIGSPVAFYAICSLCAIALMQCYCLSIACILWRRIYHPETLPQAHFSLGKFGVPINVFAVLFSLWGIFWCSWPTTFPISAKNFNWASPIFVGSILLASAYYAANGRKNYRGPVVLVQGRKVE